MNKIGGLVNVNILVEILYYTSVKCYHWEKFYEVYKESLYYFLHLTWIYNYLNKTFIKKKNLSEIVICAA